MDRIPYVIVLVSDLERSRAFYKEALGLSERAYPPASEGEVAFALQGTTLVLVSGEGSPEAIHPLPEDFPPGVSYPSFPVSNLEEFHQRLVQKGVRCLREPRQCDFGKLGIYADPDGLPILILEKHREKEKHAVVLSGGGAFGAFEVGVLRAMVNGKSGSTDHRA